MANQDNSEVVDPHQRSNLGDLLLPTPAEEQYPAADWSQTWQNMRWRGLSPEQKSTPFKFCNNLIPNGVQLQNFKMASTSTCQFCNEVDGKLHFLTCVQANHIGAFTKEALSSLFFQQGNFSWEKVGIVEIFTASHSERLAGLILLSEVVHHISTTRRRGQEASSTKFSATLSRRGGL